MSPLISIPRHVHLSLDDVPPRRLCFLFVGLSSGGMASPSPPVLALAATTSRLAVPPPPYGALLLSLPRAISAGLAHCARCRDEGRARLNRRQVDVPRTHGAGRSERVERGERDVSPGTCNALAPLSLVTASIHDRLLQHLVVLAACGSPPQPGSLHVTRKSASSHQPPCFPGSRPVVFTTWNDSSTSHNRVTC